MRGSTGSFLILIVVIFSIRFILSSVFQRVNRNADNFLKGLLQGALMYQALLSTNQIITIAIALAIGARLVRDFFTQQDSWTVPSIIIGFVLGVLAADVMSYIYNDEDWGIFALIDEYTTTKKYRSHRHPIRRRVSEPRRIEDMPTLQEEVSSIDSQSHLGDQELSDVEKEIARLRAKALYAAGQYRRCREERKWALSQGNLARAFQLRWQIKKSHALALSFTREADRKLIENDRAKRSVRPEERVGGGIERHSSTPFVQVVVGNGHEPQVEEKAKEYFTDTMSRETGIHDYTKYKSRSESFYTVSGLGGQGVTSNRLESPPTSDTWSRQLD